MELLIPAFIFFGASKIISALRLNIFFREIGLNISEGSNFRLYLTGMFYNLFLPGGIGGDGYKIWLLKRTRNHSLKQITAAVLLDRINGLLAIGIMIAVGILFIPRAESFRFAVPLLTMILLFGYSIFVKLIFRNFLGSVITTTLLSLFAQLLQIITVLFISYSIGIKGSMVPISIIFLISSAVAVLPFTIGGIGARELVFLYSSQFLGIEMSSAVAVSLIFLIITAITSLAGIYYAVVLPEFELRTVS
jgi:uncharacterized membrane protein YbhN (UPF0104 family)